MWLRVSSLNSLVLSFRTTVRARRCFFARGRPELFCQATDHRVGLCQQNILLKSVLNRDRLCRPVRHDFVFVDATGEFVQAHTIAAELFFEHRQIELS